MRFSILRNEIAKLVEARRDDVQPVNVEKCRVRMNKIFMTATTNKKYETYNLLFLFFYRFKISSSIAVRCSIRSSRSCGAFECA